MGLHPILRNIQVDAVLKVPGGHVCYLVPGIKTRPLAHGARNISVPDLHVEVAGHVEPNVPCGIDQPNNATGVEQPRSIGAVQVLGYQLEATDGPIRPS